MKLEGQAWVDMKRLLIVRGRMMERASEQKERWEVLPLGEKGDRVPLMVHHRTL